MPDFTVISSNRLEILADRLAEIVRQPLATTLEAETVIVQSRGMERWISLALARRNKICANVWYPFPNIFLESLFRKIFPDLPETSPFNRDILSFRILKILPFFLDRPHFTALRRYLKDDDNGLKAYQLSQRLADLYDQYLVFRPEIILQWDAGQGESSSDYRWQAELWRALARGKEKQHRAYLNQEFQKRIETIPMVADRLPSRICLFGISYLPPFHLHSFIGLSKLVPVYLFLMSPCREYWADILTKSQMIRLAEKSKEKLAVDEFLHMEQGHPLLASMGDLGKEFFQSINEYDIQIEDCFASVAGIDLLTHIQSDLLDLIDPAISAPRQHATNHDKKLQADLKGTATRSADGSIQIHSCHSPMREIEILRDRLLDLFERDPGLKPRDVIVMTPDIGTYAPYITAVFDIHDGDGPFIPYGIADQSIGQTNPLTQCFLSLLDMPASRFSASRVLTLLSAAGIKERYGLTSADLEKITHWVGDVNVRWGRDSNDRRRNGLPATKENTWKAGVERMMLGYAMRGNGQRMFSEILPYDHIEGGDTKILGRFIEFLHRLFEWSERLDTSLPPAAWQSLLTQLLDRFIAITPDTDRDVQYIHGCLEEFGRMEQLAGFTEPLSLKMVRMHLENQFDRRLGESGFLSGGVTFCAMLPMRSIPFKVVCLIGLNTDAFPRDDHPLGFDLIAEHPRRGDRSRRKDDKYLFLEALVSARKVLYLSYIGQNVQDNSHVPPSVLVSELIDTIKTSFGLTEEDLVVRHPLQAYSKRYFNEREAHLFSYSGENLLAAAGAGTASVPPPFFERHLSVVSNEADTLRLEELCQFFTHPVRYLAKKRLNIRLDEPESMLEDKENFQMNALGRYQMKQILLSAVSSGLELGDFFPVVRAKGDLPQGTVGRVLYGQLGWETKQFAAEMSQIIEGESADTLPVNLTVAGFNLKGLLTGLYSHGRVQVRFARRRAKDWLTVWIYHLVLSALRGEASRPESILLDTDGTVSFQPVKHPHTYLKKLVVTYQEGLRRPLHFFPELSLRFVQMVRNEAKDPDAALKTIQDLWIGSDYKKGVSQDPYYRRCFGETNPFDEEFKSLAEMVFVPILESANG